MPFAFQPVSRGSTRQNQRRRAFERQAAEEAQRRERITGAGWLALAAGAGFAMLAWQATANAQAYGGGHGGFGQPETYACSPHSHALLSQVEMMKVAGRGIQQRWANEGFGAAVGQPNDGNRIMQVATGIAGGTNMINDITSGNAPAGPQPGVIPGTNGAFGSHASMGGGMGGMGGHGDMGGGYGGPPTGPGAGGFAMPAMAGVPGMGGGMGGAGYGGGHAQMAMASPMSAAGQAAGTPDLAQQMGLGPNSLLGANPQQLNAGLNDMMNSVNPIAPSYERFFQAHPSMKTHLEMAQSMGYVTPAVNVDPAAVARQFGIEYDGNSMDPYAYIPPNTGSALSRIAMRFRSLFY
ncbi:MAG: hypothetical protein KI792_07775 [Alphaproteobacteria bacterium]|nr:hypothetical protein [Alphaproteobacteria bacterium SS10]